LVVLVQLVQQVQYWMVENYQDLLDWKKSKIEELEKAKNGKKRPLNF
jgi:hypothetical protein